MHNYIHTNQQVIRIYKCMCTVYNIAEHEHHD